MNNLKADGQLPSSLPRNSIIHKLERYDSNSEINLWIHYWYRGVNVLPSCLRQKRTQLAGNNGKINQFLKSS